MWELGTEMLLYDVGWVWQAAGLDPAVHISRVLAVAGWTCSDATLNVNSESVYTRDIVTPWHRGQPGLRPMWVFLCLEMTNAMPPCKTVVTKVNGMSGAHMCVLWALQYDLDFDCWLTVVDDVELLLPLWPPVTSVHTWQQIPLLDSPLLCKNIWYKWHKLPGPFIVCPHSHLKNIRKQTHTK